MALRGNAHAPALPPSVTATPLTPLPLDWGMASSISRDWTPDRSEPTPRSGVWLTDVLLVLMALIWGVNYIVVKAATGYFAPLAFNAMRVTLATVVLGALAYHTRE